MSRAKWIFLGVTTAALACFVAGVLVAFISPDCAPTASFDCEVEHDAMLQTWSLTLWGLGFALLVAGAVIYAMSLRQVT